jgi:hypothetical protein
MGFLADRPWSNRTVVVRLEAVVSHTSFRVVLESFIVVVPQERRVIGSLVEWSSASQNIV